jgi:WD40 repeat protein
VWSVAFSADGSLLASGSHKDSIRVWKVADRTELFPKPAQDDAESKEGGEGQ